MKHYNNYLKSRWFLLVMLVLFSSCEKESNPNNEGNNVTTVQLIDNDNYVIFEKYVTIYNNSDYLIKVPLGYFINGLADFFSFSYTSYLNTLDEIISEAENENELSASAFFESNRMEYLIAHYLEYSKCYVYDKKNKTVISEIKIESWSNFAPLSGSAGRKFFINGELFLEVIDLIS